MSIFPTKILLATDGSEEATLAARTAVDVAQKTDSELHMVYVLVPVLVLRDEAQKVLDAKVKQVKAAGGNVTQTYLKVGRPDAEIVALAEEIGAGLIVMGSRGLGGMRRILLGSVSESVVHHAHCPVLVVRKEELQEATEEAGPEEVGLV